MPIGIVYAAYPPGYVKLNLIHRKICIKTKNTKEKSKSFLLKIPAIKIIIFKIQI